MVQERFRLSITLLSMSSRSASLRKWPKHEHHQFLLAELIPNVRAGRALAGYLDGLLLGL